MSEAGSYKLTVIPGEGYLHFVVNGLNTRMNVISYLRDVLYECKKRKCSRVLIEEHLAGPRLGLADVFQIVSEGSNDLWGVIRAIAYVDMNEEGDLMKFAETVGVNRTIPIMVFSTLSEAERWIKDKVTKKGKSI